MRRRRYYGAFLKLTGRRCVVVGGGRVAERKVHGLLTAGARVRVVSPELTPSLQAWAAEGLIEHAERMYQQSDLQDAWLAVAATDDAGVNLRVAEDAEGHRQWVNVVHAGETGSFIVPAIAEYGPVQVAITTSGADPSLAKALKEALLDDIAAGRGQFAQLLRQRVSPATGE